MAQIRDEIRDFRQATTSSLNATRDLTDVRTKVDDGFTAVDNGFAEIRGRLDATATGQEQIAALLNRLIAHEGDQTDSR